MERHYTYLGDLLGRTPLAHLSSDPEWLANCDKFLSAGVVVAVLIWVGRVFSRRLLAARDPKALFVPDSRPSLTGIVDLFLEIFVKYQDSIMGREGRVFLPFTGTVFFLLLGSNLISLIPGVAAATTTVWVNVGVAIVVFIYFNSLGVRAHGLGGYLKHFCGPMIAIAVILFPVEIISTLLRMLTLNLRLYWNITADHLVLGIFTGLIPYFPLPGIPFYALGTFVALVQALIFTTLTMVYISLAVQHEEEA